LKVDVKKASVLRAWEAARIALCRDGRSDGLQRAAGSTVRELAAATRGFAAPAVADAISAPQHHYRRGILLMRTMQISEGAIDDRVRAPARNLFGAFLCFGYSVKMIF
jgi:hypothetical protein